MKPPQHEPAGAAPLNTKMLWPPTQHCHATPAQLALHARETTRYTANTAKRETSPETTEAQCRRLPTSALGVPRAARAQPLLHARIAPALSCSALPSYAARALIRPSPPEPEIHLARFDAKKTRQLEGGGGVWGGLNETLHG
eukprot:CAMPEP_0180178618 /NCGR_PEP_ID=MMETSP0986-20121125/38533_1 /TAXON_ID=697907 /ORGANISM="non described non described, Strain CCMP2293" /LENGTH=141 /DNA_ID=CAMNT_0022131541 /DNA_START=318 /DNA_END=744 /DNA_ORIENTATION=+